MRLNRGLVLLALLVVQLLGACLPIYRAAASEQVTVVSEKYTVRPKIEDVEARSHGSLDKSWHALKRAHLAFLAELMELYPDRDIYFLARDSELLHDAARLLVKNPSELKRLHVLNVSRANMRDEHLVDYLAQEGISETTLQSGKKILFVDTGFTGTIPHVIAQHFSQKFSGSFKTQLIVSNNQAHPSSRVFLERINPAISNHAPSSFHSTILAYEYMPRATYRADSYEIENGRWLPTSHSLKETDGSVNRELAVNYMEDLKFSMLSEAAQKEFSHQRELWRSILAVFQDRHLTKTEKISLLKNIIGKSPSASEAMIRDLFDAEKITGSKTDVSLEDLGISPEQAKPTTLNKIELAAKYPQWKTVFEDPETAISDLLKKNDYQTLISVLSVTDDVETTQLVVEKIREEPDSLGRRALIKSLVNSGNPKTLSWVAFRLGEVIDPFQNEDIFKTLIESANPDTVSWAALRLLQVDLSKSAFLKTLVIESIDKYGSHIAKHLSDEKIVKINGEKSPDVFISSLKNIDDKSMYLWNYLFQHFKNSLITSALKQQLQSRTHNKTPEVQDHVVYAISYGWLEAQRVLNLEDSKLLAKLILENVDPMILGQLKDKIMGYQADEKSDSRYEKYKFILAGHPPNSCRAIFHP